jgi:hypothetical protein
MGEGLVARERLLTYARIAPRNFRDRCERHVDAFR